jgi:hypothetical protein
MKSFSLTIAFFFVSIFLLGQTDTNNLRQVLRTLKQLNQQPILDTSLQLLLMMLLRYQATMFLSKSMIILRIPLLELVLHSFYLKTP